MRTEDLALALDLVADIMIPPSGEWPAPSVLHLGADLLTRVRDHERDGLVRAMELLDEGESFAEVGDDARIARLESVARSEPSVFELLRRCVYYAYYAQPAVVRVLRGKGYDINEAPQPNGYHMDPIAPENLARIDRSRVVWIPADQVGASLRTAS